VYWRVALLEGARFASNDRSMESSKEGMTTPPDGSTETVDDSVLKAVVGEEEIT
jgi:hypothetical protein